MGWEFFSGMETQGRWSMVGAWLKKAQAGFTRDSWAVASGLAIWSGRRAVETWPVKGMSVCCIALWQSLKKFEGYIKEDPVGAQIWKGTGADEKNLPMCLLKVATCAH